uniref:Uncharacterized protein n=1 Tax=Anguilla anguilla TaxID=7936 RepID=A0A0E9RY96_ANGAN
MHTVCFASSHRSHTVWPPNHSTHGNKKKRWQCSTFGMHKRVLTSKTMQIGLDFKSHNAP